MFSAGGIKDTHDTIYKKKFVPKQAADALRVSIITKLALDAELEAEKQARIRRCEELVEADERQMMWDNDVHLPPPVDVILELEGPRVRMLKLGGRRRGAEDADDEDEGPFHEDDDEKSMRILNRVVGHKV